MCAENQHISYFMEEDRIIEIVFYDNVSTSYPNHTHVHHHTIGYVLEGEVELESQGKIQKCYAEDFFVVMPDTLHAFWTEKNYTMISICIQSEYLYGNELEDTANRIKSLLLTLWKTEQNVAEHYDKIEDALVVLYATLTGIPPLTNSYSYRVKERLLREPENPFCIEEMAQLVAVSPYHLIRQFKIETGLTPHQFQIQSRIRKAQRLLEEKYSVTKVAFETGFCDQSHFDRCFKKIVGILPADYKKAVQKSDS